MQEIWKDIPNYEGLYEVSNFGRVRNRHGIILSPSRCRNRGGYHQVGLVKDGKRKFYRVHRLVWMGFNGPIPDNMEVNHMDQDVTNNRLDNLNLLTRTDNLRWGDGIDRRAVKHHKKVYQYDLSGNFIREWPSVKSIEEETGINRGNIACCCRKVSHYKTSGGFIWSYTKL